MKNNFQSGFMSYIVIIIVIAVISGGAYYFSARTDENSAKEVDEMMMEEDAMMEDGDAMMSDEKLEDTTMQVPASGHEGVDEMMVNEEGSMMDNNEMMEVGQLVFTGNVIAGSRAPLLEFNKIDYDNALNSDKLVVLYFYANWCPICKEEVANALYPVFNELETDQVVGFRVNYNDNETNKDEKDLAREFGVAYQHTKVFLKNGERVLKSPESWRADRYVSEIAKYTK